MFSALDSRPWHLEQSYVATGWHRPDTYSSVLPDLKRPVGLARVAAKGPSEIRPQSGRTRQEIAKYSGATTDLISGTPETVVVKNIHEDEEPNVERTRLAQPEDRSSSLGLQELCLRSVSTNDMSLATLAARHPRLRSLDVSYCEVTDLSSVSALTELRELRAARCMLAVTPDFVASLQKVRKLEVLDLSFCPGVNSAGLMSCADGCRALRWLNLMGCSQISDEGLLALTHANPGITHMALALNPRSITDEGVSRTLRGLLRIRFLDFAGCPQLHWHTPRAIVRHCEYLEDLSFASNRELRDDDVRNIMKKCVHLRSLNLTGCRSITDEVLIENMPRAQHLTRLLLSMCPNVSDSATLLLRAQYPACVIERHARAEVNPDDLGMFVKQAVARKAKQKKTAKAAGDKKQAGKSPISPRAKSPRAKKK